MPVLSTSPRTPSGAPTRDWNRTRRPRLNRGTCTVVSCDHLPGRPSPSSRESSPLESGSTTLHWSPAMAHPSTQSLLPHPQIPLESPISTVTYGSLRYLSRLSFSRCLRTDPPGECRGCESPTIFPSPGVFSDTPRRSLPFPPVYSHPRSSGLLFGGGHSSGLLLRRRRRSSLRCGLGDSHAGAPSSLSPGPTSPRASAPPEARVVGNLSKGVLSYPTPLDRPPTPDPPP